MLRRNAKELRKSRWIKTGNRDRFWQISTKSSEIGFVVLPFSMGIRSMRDLNQVLDDAAFDAFVEEACTRF